MKLPQLTLRDLFWLVLIVAMGCAWWVEHAQLTDELNRLNLRRFIENQIEI